MTKSLFSRLKWPLLAYTLLTTGLTYGANSPIGVGVVGGASFISSNTNFTYGAEATYTILPEWDVGAEITYYSDSVTVPVLGSGGTFSGSTSNQTNHFTTITAKGLYNLSTLVAPGLRVGAQAGIGIASTSVPGASGTTSFIFGPTLSYDYGVGEKFTVGGESTIYINTSSGSSVDYQLLASIKYWL